MMTICKHCGAKNLVKNGRKTGRREGRFYKQQMYRCNKCWRATMGKKQYIVGETRE